MIPFFRRLARFLLVSAALVTPVLMRSNHAVVWAQEVAATSYAPASRAQWGDAMTRAAQSFAICEGARPPKAEAVP